ncbi:MAG: hypothetical protein EB127_23930, partial [Alphaproteobacteria bacterium]|nr:hypothetical protein [Alphaproteobacteria bacterium]
MSISFALPRDATGVVTTLLSTLHGAHRNGEGILCYLTTQDALALRLVNHESREAVSAFRWKDKNTRIRGSLAAWRACFPRAVWVNLIGRKNITNDDLMHLANIEILTMYTCSCTKITIDDFGCPDLNKDLRKIDPRYNNRFASMRQLLKRWL